MTREDLDRMTPLYILWLIRDERATDWVSLAPKFGIRPSESRRYTPSMMLLHKLHALREAGLIHFEDGSEADEYPVLGLIKVTDRWTRIQAALEISLTDLSGLNRNSIVVEPHFRLPSSQKVGDLFVLMPFTPTSRAIYDDHISSVASDLGLTTLRADDFFTAHAVMEDIWAAILGSQVIVADCTGRNPNVFYEMGLAHALGKPVVLITQSSDDVPFDIGHLRYIQYDYTPRGVRILERRLADTLRAELGLTIGPHRPDIKISYVVADGTSESSAQFEQEVSSINKKLELFGMRDQFRSSYYYVPVLARAMTHDEGNPSIVHLIGNAGGPTAIMDGDSKQACPVDLTDLGAAFQSTAGDISCVVLSGCYQNDQAGAIAAHVKNVIGVPAGVSTIFSPEFYFALGLGRSIKDAFEFASDAISEAEPEMGSRLVLLTNPSNS